MGNIVQVAPWKISFTPEGNGPYAVKVKLADLLFDQTSSPWVPRYLPPGKGVNLLHDIILFDPNIYATSGGGSIVTSDATRDLRQNHGIFLSKITYDARSAPAWVANVAYAPLNSPGDAHHGQAGYYIYPTEAALPVIEMDYSLTSNKAYYDSSIIPTDLYNPALPYNSITNPYMCYQSSVTLAIAGTTAAATSAMILSSPDLALQATIPGSSLLPYTRIYLSGDTMNLTEVVNILRFFTNYGYVNGSAMIDPSTGAAYSVLDLVNPEKNTYLQHCEIWIRCSYFADYITPVAFQQDLSPTSQAAHKNMIVGAGDFSRFTREAADAEIKPYTPITPPRNDLLTSALTISTAGTFPIPSKTGEYNAAGTGRRAPMGWADPDIDTAIAAGYVALPQIGNAYVSGRILSPTIDELWIYIKKMVSGTGSTAVPAEPALVLGGHTGDPISADGSIYVSAPTAITYAVDTTLATLANATVSSVGTYTFDSYVPANNPTPRSAPYSLREMESLLDNLQYNLRTAVGFFSSNAVKTGNLNPTIGTLAQLHKSYAPTSAGQAAAVWSAANTYNAAESAANYGNVLSPATGYDKAVNFVAGDAYLGADGQWHYLFDHVRLPVLAETY